MTDQTISVPRGWLHETAKLLNEVAGEGITIEGCACPSVLMFDLVVHLGAGATADPWSEAFLRTLPPTSRPTVSRNNVAVAPRAEWIFDFTDCPRGAKMLLLTDAGIAVIGSVGADARGYRAWSPLPDTPKQTTKEGG